MKKKLKCFREDTAQVPGGGADEGGERNAFRKVTRIGDFLRSGSPGTGYAVTQIE
jgi:hypothetical protein